MYFIVIIFQLMQLEISYLVSNEGVCVRDYISCQFMIFYNFVANTFVLNTV